MHARLNQFDQNLVRRLAREEIETRLPVRVTSEEIETPRT